MRAALVAIAALATACSAFGSAPTNADAQSLADDWLEETTDTQRAMLDDRVISSEEYMQALRDGAECMREAGFEVSELRDVPDDIRHDFMIGPGEREERDISADWDRCRETHYVGVESVWLLQHARLEEGEEALKGELIDCLDANGVEGATASMRDHEIWQLLDQSDATLEAWFCRERFLIYIGELGSRPRQ